jgi:hypothetical protein
VISRKKVKDFVGNKCDLASQRMVSSEQGQTQARQWRCEFLETSAKTKVGIEQAFITLASSYLKLKDSMPKEPPLHKKKRRCTIVSLRIIIINWMTGKL